MALGGCCDGECAAHAGNIALQGVGFQVELVHPQSGDSRVNRRRVAQLRKAVLYGRGAPRRQKWSAARFRNRNRLRWREAVRDPSIRSRRSLRQDDSKKAGEAELNTCNVYLRRKHRAECWRPHLSREARAVLSRGRGKTLDAVQDSASSDDRPREAYARVS